MASENQLASEIQTKWKILMQLKNEEKNLAETKKALACKKSSAKERIVQLKRECAILEKAISTQQTVWNESQAIREENAAAEQKTIELNTKLREFDQYVLAQTKQWAAEDAKYNETNPPVPKKKKPIRKRKSSNISKKRFLHTLIHMATILQNDNRLSLQLKNLVKEWKLTKTFDLEKASKVLPVKKPKGHSASKRNMSAEPGLEDVDVEQLLQNEIDSIPPLLSPMSSTCSDHEETDTAASGPQLAHACTQTDLCGTDQLIEGSKPVRSKCVQVDVGPRQKIDTECSTLLTFSCQDSLNFVPLPEIECEADHSDRDPSSNHGSAQSSVVDSTPLEDKSVNDSSCNETSKDGIEEEMLDHSETSTHSSRTAKPQVQQWLNDIPLDPELDPHYHRSVSMSPVNFESADDVHKIAVQPFGTTINQLLNQPQPYYMPNVPYPPVCPPYMMPSINPGLPYTTPVPQYNYPVYGYAFNPLYPIGGFQNAAWPQMWQTQPTVAFKIDESSKEHHEEGVISSDTQLAAQNKKEKDLPSLKKKSKLLGPASVQARKRLKAKQDQSQSAEILQESTAITPHSSCTLSSTKSVELKPAVAKKGKVLGRASTRTKRSAQAIDSHHSTSESESMEMSDDSSRKESSQNIGHTTKMNGKPASTQAMDTSCQNTKIGEKPSQYDLSLQDLRTEHSRLREQPTAGVLSYTSSEENTEDDECTESDSSSASSCKPLSVLKKKRQIVYSETEDSVSPIPANQKTAVVSSKVPTPWKLPSQVQKSAISSYVTHPPSQTEVDCKTIDNKQKIKTQGQDTTTISTTRRKSDKDVTPKSHKRRLQAKGSQKSKQVSPKKFAVAIPFPMKSTKKTDKEGGELHKIRQVSNEATSSTKQTLGETQEAWSGVNSIVLKPSVHKQSELINHTPIEPSTLQDSVPQETTSCSTTEKATMCSAVPTDGHRTHIARNEITENNVSNILKDKEDAIISATVVPVDNIESSHPTELEIDTGMEETTAPRIPESPASPEDAYHRGEYVQQSDMTLNSNTSTAELSSEVHSSINDKAGMEETAAPLIPESPASPEDAYHRGEYVQQSDKTLNSNTSTAELSSEVHSSSINNTKKLELKTKYPLIIRTEDKSKDNTVALSSTESCPRGSTKFVPLIHKKLNVSYQVPLLVDIKCPSPALSDYAETLPSLKNMENVFLNSDSAVHNKMKAEAMQMKGTSDVSPKAPVEEDHKQTAQLVTNSNFTMEIATDSDQTLEHCVAASNNLFNSATENIGQTQDLKYLEMSANVSEQTIKVKVEQRELNTVEVMKMDTAASASMILTEVNNKRTQEMKLATSNTVETASFSENSNMTLSDCDIFSKYPPKSPIVTTGRKKRRVPRPRVVESKPLEDKDFSKSDTVILGPKVEKSDIECEGKRPPKVRLSDRPDLLGLKSSSTTPTLKPKAAQSTIEALKNISCLSVNTKMKNGNNLKRTPAKNLSKLEKVSVSHSAFQAIQSRNIKIENSSENTNANKKTPHLLQASRSTFPETLDSKPLLTLKKVNKPVTQVGPPSPELPPQAASCRDSFRLPPGETEFKQDQADIVVLSSDSSDSEFNISLTHVKLQCRAQPKAMKNSNKKKLMTELFGTLSDEETPNCMDTKKELMEELFGDISDDETPGLTSAKSCKLETSGCKKKTRKRKNILGELDEWWKQPITEAPAPMSTSERHKQFEKSCLSQLLKFQPRERMMPSVPRPRLLSYDCRKISIILVRLLKVKSLTPEHMETVMLELQGFFPGTKVSTLAEALIVAATKGVPENHILELIKHLDEARWCSNFSQTLLRIIPSSLVICTPGVVSVMKTAGEMFIAVRLLMRLCKSPAMVQYVHTLLFELLCHFRIKGLELAYMMLKFRPDLLPVLNQTNVEDLPILTQCVINSMLNFKSEGEAVVAELKKLLAQEYHIVDSRSPLQLLDYVVKRLQAGVTDGVEMGLFLLAKSQGFEWSKSNMLEDVLQMLIDKYAESPEAKQAAHIALRLTGMIVRLVPYMEQNYLLKVMKRVKQFLQTEGLSHELQESAVHSLLFMAGPEQVHQLFVCVAPWQPQQPLSVKLLSHMRAWACHRLPPLIPARPRRLDPPPQPKPLTRLEPPTLDIPLVNLDSP